MQKSQILYSQWIMFWAVTGTSITATPQDGHPFWGPPVPAGVDRRKEWRRARAESRSAESAEASPLIVSSINVHSIDCHNVIMSQLSSIEQPHSCSCQGPRLGATDTSKAADTSKALEMMGVILKMSNHVNVFRSRRMKGFRKSFSCCLLLAHPTCHVQFDSLDDRTFPIWIVSFSFVPACPQTFATGDSSLACSGAETSRTCFECQRGKT